MNPAFLTILSGRSTGAMADAGRDFTPNYTPAVES